MINLIKISVTTGFAILLSTSAMAIQPDMGFIGADLGYGETHVSNADHVTRFAYGLNAGYNADQYVGFEVQANRDAFYKYNGTDYTYKIYDADLLADGYVPLDNKFDLVGKAGLAYVRETDNGHFYRPKLAAGVVYSASANMNIGATYSRIFKQGNINQSARYLPDVDVAAVTFDYLF